MLELNVKNHGAFEQLQAVYVSVVQEYMKKEGLKVLDKLIDIEFDKKIQPSCGKSLHR